MQYVFAQTLYERLKNIDKISFIYQLVCGFSDFIQERATYFPSNSIYNRIIVL